MKVYFEKENKTEEFSLDKPIKIKDLLKKKGISVNSVILSLNGQICLEDELISNDDKLEILSVVSGG